MGFCLINNVAVAAAHLRDRGLAQRVAVIDFDVHHGNGTQDIFYSEPDVLYISTHQFPLYPGTGRVWTRPATATPSARRLICRFHAGLRRRRIPCLHGRRRRSRRCDAFRTRR